MLWNNTNRNLVLISFWEVKKDFINLNQIKRKQRTHFKSYFEIAKEAAALQTANSDLFSRLHSCVRCVPVCWYKYVYLPQFLHNFVSYLMLKLNQCRSANPWKINKICMLGPGRPDWWWLVQPHHLTCLYLHQNVL